MHDIHLILQKVIIISCSLCYSPKWLVILQMHSPSTWHASTLGQVLMKQFHSSHKHLHTIPVLTLLPRIWLIAALSFRVHSATTFALISFMYNIKAFRGFLMWGLFGSCSFLCSCWGFLKGGCGGVGGGGRWNKENLGGEKQSICLHLSQTQAGDNPLRLSTNPSPHLPPTPLIQNSNSSTLRVRSLWFEKIPLELQKCWTQNGNECVKLSSLVTSQKLNL